MTHGVLLIGCGAMAQVHCQALSKLENVRLVSAVDLNLDAALHVQKTYGFARVATDYRTELTRQDFDVVLCATHWSRRFDIIRDCFDAGKHVLAEKPLSVYPHEVNALCALAEAKGRKLRVGMMERYRPMFLKIASMLQEGVIGKPQVYSFMHHQRPAPQALQKGWEYYKRLLAGGVTPNIDCGIHKCDLVRMFSGAQAMRVLSVGQRMEADSPGANFTHSVFWMSDGSTLTLEDCYSRATEPFIHMWMLGPKGRLRFEYAGSHDRPFPQSAEDVIHVWRTDQALHETHYTPCEIKPVGPQMEAFLREIDDNLDMHWHHENVRQATEMVVASALSEHRGEMVSLPLTARDHQDITTLITR